MSNRVIRRNGLCQSQQLCQIVTGLAKRNTAAVRGLDSGCTLWTLRWPAELSVAHSGLRIH